MNLKLLTKYRKDLHQIPEIAFDLFETQAYLRKELEKMGYTVETVAKSGLVAQRQGISKESIAFRSDMDALPVNEMSGISYASKNQGKMHACGHDGHMAMLLGLASYLSTIELKKESIVFIFQPAEEGPGGANVIIQEGIFEKYNIKNIFGIHLYPGLQEGIYGLANGPMLAQNAEFTLKITGQSAHGAQPHLGTDAILAASSLMNQYHTIVSRFLDPLDTAVLTVGTIHAGEARNIIAKEALITGTIRSFSDDVAKTIKRKMHDIDLGICKAYDVIVENSIEDYYPPVVNPEPLFLMLRDSLKKEQFQIIKPLMFAEDFAFYQKKVPGMFVLLGTKNEKKNFIHPLHSCYFNFDESILIKGVELYIHILQTMKVI